MPALKPWKHRIAEWRMIILFAVVVVPLLIFGEPIVRIIVGGMVIFSIIVSYLLMRWEPEYIRRDRLDLCPRCGYDLRASIDQCPECGEVMIYHVVVYNDDIHTFDEAAQAIIDAGIFDQASAMRFARDASNRGSALIAETNRTQAAAMCQQLKSRGMRSSISTAKRPPEYFNPDAVADEIESTE